MNILLDDKDYKLYDLADENVTCSDIINDGLNLARKILSLPTLAEFIDQIPFDGVYAYDSSNINAFSIREGGTYLIGFSFAYFVNIRRWLNLWMKAPTIDEIFTFNDKKSKDIFFDNVHYFIIMFTVTHELYHILDGHCDIPQNRNHFMLEYNSNTQNSMDTLFSQCLEYDADYSSCIFCASAIMQVKHTSIFEKLDLIRELGFGLYNLFLLFCADDKQTSFEFVVNSDFSADDHPHPSLRIRYSLSLIMSIVLNHITLNQCTSAFKLFVNEFISYDRILMQHGSLKDCLFSVGFTKKGTQHLLLLNNSWSSVKKNLEPFTHIPLNDRLILEKASYWIDEKGDFITHNNSDT